MAFDSEKFIIDLVRQLNINNMDDARYERLKDLQKKKVATPEQNSWERGVSLPPINATTPGANPGDPDTYTYTGEDVTTTTTPPSTNDLKDLYEKIQGMLYEVSEDTELMKDKKVSGFVNDYYGSGKAVANLQYIPTISDIEAQNLGDYIQNNISNILMPLGMTEQEKDLKKLAKALLDSPPTYTNKTKYIETLQSFLVHLYNCDKLGDLPAGLPGFLQIEKPLEDTDANNIGDYIDSNIVDIEASTGIRQSYLRDLANRMKTGSSLDYHTDTRVYNILKLLLDKANNGEIFPSPPPALFDQAERILNYVPGQINLDRQKIQKLRTDIETVTAPTAPQLDSFYTDLEPMLNKLVTNDKLREKLFTKAPNDLRGWFNDGFEKSNYKTGDNALAPKYEDRKTFWANAKSKVKDFYNDTLGKLSQKHTRHKYQTNARYIVAGLIDKGVKPTDGTAKILNTLDAIMADLPSPVQDQVKKIKTFLNKHAKTKYFTQALHDGDQMRQLVQEIAKEASRGDGIDMQSAEVALEMLAVMRYTLTTSSIRDKMYKAQVTIFSDPAMSYNKGPLKHFSNMVDGVIRGTMLAAFEVGNLAKNAINEHGVKFGQGKDRLDKRIIDSPDYRDHPDRRAKMEYLFGFWDNVNTSTNTKDYNILARHSEVQKDADKPAGVPSITNPITGATIDNPTKQQKQTMEWLSQNHIGRD